MTQRSGKKRRVQNVDVVLDGLRGSVPLLGQVTKRRPPPSQETRCVTTFLVVDMRWAPHGIRSDRIRDRMDGRATLYMCGDFG